MPGIFGTAGSPDRVFDDLAAAYQGVWGDVESLDAGSFRLGGHAFGGRRALSRESEDRAVAVDGEYSVYRVLERGRDLYALEEGRLTRRPRCRGNVVVADLSSSTLHVATEPSGLFPLYFATVGDGLAFASHLRPLAHALGKVDLDPIGLTVFLHDGYFVGDHTFFREVRRARPGQSLTFLARDGSLEIRESSTLWSSVRSDRSAPSSDEAVADAAWEHLTRATAEAVDGASRAGLLLSAGWDSRTLLAAALREEGTALTAYSHGDPESREVDLIARIRETVGLPGRVIPLTEDLFDVEFLETLFRRSECLLFPYWAHTGQSARTEGSTVAMAGIYGEVLGGHYGPAAHRDGARRAADVLTRLLPIGSLTDHLFASPSTEQVVAHFRSTLASRPWCLDGDKWRSHPGLGDAIKAVVGDEADRLLTRGVRDGATLVEAFTTEHRGAQYIGAQLRTARSAVDVAAPFAHQEPLAFAAKLQLEHKLHNRVNRTILRRHAPDLLTPPLAATLVSASAPLVIQEASRFLRKAGGNARWRAHRLSGGRIDPPRLGWINFEFLRGTDVLRRLVDQLRSDIWDREAIEERVERVESGKWKGYLHPLVHQCLKMVTTEWMIR